MPREAQVLPARAKLFIKANTIEEFMPAFTTAKKAHEQMYPNFHWKLEYIDPSEPDEEAGFYAHLIGNESNILAVFLKRMLLAMIERAERWIL